MTSLRFSALLLPLSLLATGCDPHDEDRVDAVAISGSTVVITAHTTTVGGYGCGGLDDGTPALLVSSDAGRSFERVIPDGDQMFGAIAVKDGTFFALRTDDNGFTVVSSTDGSRWIERITGAVTAHDLIVDDDGIHVAHAAGVMSSPDGAGWTDHRADDGSHAYAPSLARVGALFVRGTGDGTLATSTDGTAWAPRAVPTITSIHRLAAASGRALAIAHADRPEGYGAYLIELDPATDAPAIFAPIGDGVMAIVDAPAGVLIADGTLATGAITARTAHTAAFTAGAVDGQRVVLASDRGVAISTDGGATFGPAVALPMVR